MSKTEQLKEQVLADEVELFTSTLDDCILQPTQCILEPIIQERVIHRSENQKLIQTNTFKIKSINNESIENPFYNVNDFVVITGNSKLATTPISFKVQGEIKKYLLATTYDLKFKLKSYASLSK